MPPKDLFEEMYRQLQSLQKDVETLKKQKGVVLTSTKEEVGFVKEDGTIVTLERHAKRKFIDEADRKTTFDKFAAELTKNGLPVNYENLSKLGLGRGVQRQFLAKRKQRSHELPSELSDQEHEEPSANAPADPTRAHAPERADQKQGQEQKRDEQNSTHNKHAANEKYHTLQPNEKVIAPNPKGEKAREIAHSRDKAVFGEDRVIVEEDCEGKVTVPVELSKKKWRKLCVE